MNLSNKKKITRLSQQRVEELGIALSHMEKEVRESYQSLGDAVVNMQLTHLLENVYQLGKVQGIYEVFGGYVNRSFGVVVEKDGKTHDYFVRKYKMGVTDEDMRVEHAMITYAISHGMQEMSRVYAAPDGSTFFRMDEIVDGKKVSRAFAVYEFLQGDDRYSWINTDMTVNEDISFGKLLGAFHNSTYGFNPGEKAEPPIVSYLPNLKEKFADCVSALPSGNRFRTLWEKEMDLIMNSCDEAYGYLSSAEVKSGLPEACCHCDFHPGNVKWTGETASGLFDLDWSKLDMRLFDICYSYLYMATSWEMEDNGHFDTERLSLLMKGYCSTVGGENGAPALTDTERKAFPKMLIAGMLYLLNWCSSYVEDADSLNEYEYLFYLTHTLNALKEACERQDEFAAIAAQF